MRLLTSLNFLGHLLGTALGMLLSVLVLSFCFIAE
jgi:hypothetical protein